MQGREFRTQKNSWEDNLCVCVVLEVTKSDATGLLLVKQMKDVVYRQKSHTRRLLQQIMEPTVRLRENNGIVKKGKRLSFETRRIVPTGRWRLFCTVIAVT